MNILDGFSGIGGFSLAMQRAGIKIDKHYHSEIDKYANFIYRKRFPGAIPLGDITTIGNDLGKIDIATFGFPCQPFSIAGKRRGLEDTRGTFFFEIERIARFYKPSYMVLENVKGLGSHDGGNTIRIILDKLRGLDYAVQLLLLNTVDFGIPQNRERYFFICTLRGERQPEISRIREYKTEAAFSANCIDANYYKGIDNHGQRTCIEVGTLRTYKDEEGFRKMQDGICPTIQARAREDGSGQPVVVTPANNRKRKKNRYSEIVPCLSPGAQAKNSDNNPLLVKPVCTPERDKHGVMINDSIIRRLTPLECERLQDYPDNWTKYGRSDNSIKIPISDSQRYKTLGNSITVRPAEMIFRAIKDAINGT